jgi:hypothetical protein
MSGTRRVGLAAYFPAHLNTYRRCPQQYYLQYVKRHPRRTGIDRSAATRGAITHNVLNHAFRHFRRHKGFPAGLDRRIRDSFTVDDYPSHDHWRRDVSAVVDWVELAVESFDQRKDILAVEQVYTYPLPSRTGAFHEPPSFLKARVDLVARQDDGVVEHIDWKTGKRGFTDDVEIQNVASRIAIGKATQESRIVSTVSFLSATDGVVDDRYVMTEQEVRQGWRTIKDLVNTICDDGDWSPSQGPLCNWCPFYQHGCKLHRARDVEL